MWAFIKARLWIWNIHRIRRWCGQMCSCSWTMWRDFVSQASNPLPSPHPWSAGKLSCAAVPLFYTNSLSFGKSQPKGQYWQDLCPPRVFWQEQKRQWLLWPSRDGAFTWSTGMGEEVAWGQQSSTWLSSHQDSVPTCQQWPFSFFYSGFLAGHSCVSSRHSSDFYHKPKELLLQLPVCVVSETLN